MCHLWQNWENCHSNHFLWLRWDTPIEKGSGGTWVAQSFESLTLHFGSGHDPRVRGSSPRQALCWVWHLLNILSLPLLLSPACALSLSLLKKKEKKKWKRLSGGWAEGTRTRWSQPPTTHCLCSELIALLAQDLQSQEHGESSSICEGFKQGCFKMDLEKKQGIL